VIALFEETPPKYAQQAKAFGFDMQKAIDEKKVELVYLRPLDLSVDETLYAIQQAVDRVKARRVAVDSLTGLEIALAPPFKDDVRESLYRLLGALTGAGISVMMTIEITESYTELRFSPHAVSFMTHDIVLQRYVEINGELRTVMTVVKTRGRGHKRELRSYEIGETGSKWEVSFVVTRASSPRYRGSSAIRTLPARVSGKGRRRRLANRRAAADKKTRRSRSAFSLTLRSKTFRGP